MNKWLKVSIGLIIVILLGAIGYLFWQGWQNKKIDNNIEAPTTVDDNNDNVNQQPDDWQQPLNDNSGQVIDSSSMSNGNNLTADEEELLAKATVEQVSRSFVEVFGSYSTDTHYQNLYDVREMLTNSYWGQLETYISNEENEDSYSIWTDVLKAKVQKLNSSSAQVLVKTRRGERLNKKSEEKVFEQEAEVFLLKENNTWLVNKVNWLD